MAGMKRARANSTQMIASWENCRAPFWHEAGVQPCDRLGVDRVRRRIICRTGDVRTENTQLVPEQWPDDALITVRCKRAKSGDCEGVVRIVYTRGVPKKPQFGYLPGMPVKHDVPPGDPRRLPTPRMSDRGWNLPQNGIGQIGPGVQSGTGAERAHIRVYKGGRGGRHAGYRRIQTRYLGRRHGLGGGRMGLRGGCRRWLGGGCVRGGVRPRAKSS